MRIADIIGNEHLLELLRGQPPPPAALFVGAEGVGKRTVALALAALANCRHPIDHELCGVCGSCVRAEAGNHPDIQLYVPEKNVIKIEAMRELSREAHYRPFEGQARFFIVDQAEKMTEEAANSLLKTLEEPPASSHLVLVTAYPQRLLPTIRSRCQAFTFHSLARKHILAYLRSSGRSESAELRAAFADGSIGKALSLDLDTLQRDRDAMLDFLEAWNSSPSFETVFKRTESPPLRNDLKNRERARGYLELLQTLAEDIYFIHTGTSDRLVNVDRRSELERLAKQVPLDWIGNLLYHIGQSCWDVDHYVSPLMSFETLWLRAAQR